ncbi:hypothetical protein BLKGLAD_13890 [Burkholderia gladioli pv. gladioli]
MSDEYRAYLSTFGVIVYEASEVYGLGVPDDYYLNVVNAWRDLSRDSNYPAQAVPLLEIGDGHYWLYDNAAQALLHWATPNGGVVETLAWPLKPFLSALCALRSRARSGIRVRTALVTARSAPAHERAIRTLMAWNVAADEAMFLGGKDKTRFLAEFMPDIFFDDHPRNCESAARCVATGHVPYCINNEPRTALH